MNSSAITAPVEGISFTGVAVATFTDPGGPEPPGEEHDEACVAVAV